MGMITSKYKIAEQLSFSINVCQSIVSHADKLVETENEETLTCTSSSSSFLCQSKKMVLVFPGIYAEGVIHFFYK